MDSLPTLIKALGTTALLRTAYSTALFIYTHFLRPSGLPKYLHPSKDSWAIVTGASDGIGLSLARELLRNGFNVFIHGRNEGKLSGLAEKLGKEFPGRKVEFVVADAAAQDCDFAAIASKIRSITQHQGGILTILINNVGGIQTYPQFMPLDRIDGQHIDQTIAVNARFPTRLTAALLPILKQNTPSLVLTAGSYGGTQGIPYIITYTSTKAYLHNFTAGLRAELFADRVYGLDVQSSLIGNTSSAGNSSTMFGTISSETCARGMLAKTGSGDVLVSPHVVPWAVGNLMGLFPEWVGLRAFAGEMRKRRKEELEEAEGKKGK
jgi:17beta-estradiol 17-dehydrogenase / very-long-chain 3-oxoacyl-CoA reductase